MNTTTNTTTTNNNNNNTIRLADDPHTCVFLDYAADIQNRTGCEFVDTTVLSRFLDSFDCNILVAMNIWSSWTSTASCQTL